MGTHAALTAAELSAVAGPTTVKGYLSVWNPTVLTHAHVSNAGGVAITYPLTALPIKNIADLTAWGTVKTGSTFRVTNAATGAKHYYRMRKPPDANYVYIMEMASGDAGLMPDKGSAGLWFVDNDLVEVYDRFDLWSALPYLTYSGGVFTYKEDYFTTAEWATAFSISQNAAPGPVINLGRHQSKWANGSTAEFTLTCTYTNWVGSAYNYINWVLPTGATFVAGYDAQDTTIKINVPVGCWIIECQVGTTGGLFNVDHAYRCLWVHDPVSYPPIPITAISSDTSDRTGRRMTFTLNDDLLSNFLEGSICNFWEEPTFNGGYEGGSLSVTGATAARTSIGAGTYEAAQSLAYPGGWLTQLTFTLDSNTGSPTGTITWELRNDVDGTIGSTILATGTISPTASATNTITPTGTWLPAQRVWFRLWATAHPAGAWRWIAETPRVYADQVIATSNDNGATYSYNTSFNFLCSLTCTGITSAVTNFTGWLIRSERTGEEGLRTGSFDLVGPSELLNHLGGYSGSFTRTASPTTWADLDDDLANVNFLTWYLLRVRAPMVVQLFDHHPYFTPPLAHNYYWGFKSYVLQPGTLLSQVQSIAAGLGANYGHDSEGAAWIRRHPWLRTDSAVYPRDGTQTAATDIPLPDPLVFRATLTAAKISSIRIPRAYRPSCRRVRGEGLYYHVAGGDDLPVACDMPGTTPGQGAKETKTDPYQLWDVSVDVYEFLRFTGMYYAQENNPTPEVSYEFPYNFDFVEPAQMYVLANNIPAAYMADNVAFTENVAPATVTRRWADGTKSISVDGEAETWGSDAVSVW